MRSTPPRLRAAFRSWKRRGRAPVLRALRASAWYRAWSGLPRNEIVGCRAYVLEDRSAGQAFLPLDEPVRRRIDGDGGEAGDGPRIFAGLRDLEFPATFVATLSECRLYGRGVAIVSRDGRVIAEGSIPIGGSPVEHAIMGRAFLPRPVRLPGTTAVLSAPAGNTYYHWLFDVLPRIALLRRAGVEIASVDRVAVNSARRPYQHETLTRLGIRSERVFETDFALHAICDRMVLPSYAGTSGAPPRWACTFLRDTFLPTDAARAGDGPERIYVSRQESGSRRVENAGEVEETLRRAGFVTVYPERLDVAGQARLFGGARFVVAPHGSGLSNLVFSDPGTVVVELFPPDAIERTHYRVLALQCGLRHLALVGEPGTRNARTGDFFVPTSRLPSLL